MFGSGLQGVSPTSVLEVGDPLTRVGQVAVYDLETPCVSWQVTAKIDGIVTNDDGSKRFSYEFLDAVSVDTPNSAA